MGDFLKDAYFEKQIENEKEVKIISLKDFLKPSYEAIEREKRKKQAKQDGSLVSLLESDGREIAKSLFGFLTSAFVDISDGATCLEFEQETENLEIYVNIKRKGTE